MAKAKVIFNPNAVVIYTRVSTGEQGRSGLGLEAQLEACRRYCTSTGKEILGEFQEVVSGTADLKLRTEFSYAILLAQRHGASLLIAKLDRLGRDVCMISGYMNRSLFGIGTPPLIVAESPFATEFELHLRATLAHEERRMIGDRTKAALGIRKAQGMELGKAGRAVAWDKARNATEGAVARARELKATGITLDAIARQLNSENFCTSRGSDWTKQALHRRLSA